MNEIARDIDGTALENDTEYTVLNGQFFPADKVTLDENGKSFVYDFTEVKEIQKIELFKTNLERKSRIRERDLHIYTKQNKDDGWTELASDNWNYEVDPKNQSIHFNLKNSLKTQFLKIRTIWDDRNIENENVSDYVTFSNDSVQKMIRIWTVTNHRDENYTYDKNSNRTSLTENGNNRSYTYYKNSAGGNTARVMYDGKWWYTYDKNGNRTARASNAIHNNNKVTLDKTCEYWEYTWDYHNRLVKVQQFNAPDNAQNVCVDYVYDANNHRIERISKTTADEVKTQYAYGRNGAITYQKKIIGNEITSRTYSYLNEQIIGFIDRTSDNSEALRTVVTDIQGSVTEVYDENCFLLWKSGYTAFGIKAVEITKHLDFDGLYTGYDYDAETGLTYHWNRWQSEDGDSWLTQDPARDGMNWYGYAGQNPTNFIDPLGLYPYNNLNEAMEDYYTNFATETDIKQMQFFGLINQASMGNKSAQNTLKFAFHQANQEMLQDISDKSGKASLVFLAIGCPEASGAFGTVSMVADTLMGIDNIFNDNGKEGLSQLITVAASYGASKGVEQAVSRIANIQITVGKTGRYYEIGKRGAIKTEKALRKMVAKDIAKGYFGENIAPEMASQIVEQSVEAFKTIKESQANNNKEEKKNEK